MDTNDANGQAATTLDNNFAISAKPQRHPDRNASNLAYDVLKEEMQALIDRITHLPENSAVPDSLRQQATQAQATIRRLDTYLEENRTLERTTASAAVESLLQSSRAMREIVDPRQTGRILHIT